MPWSRFIDLEYDDEERTDALMPIAGDRPSYPPGLCICLCEPELKKLEIDEMPGVGDMIDLRGFARVTSVSEGPMGRRLELQLQMLAIEDESEEGPDELGYDEE